MYIYIHIYTYIYIYIYIYIGMGGGFMGTYQRNSMTAIGALLKGMIGPSTCKYRLHVEMSRFRPELEYGQKQSIHERAMAQVCIYVNRCI
jgi:hypothetical protein